MRTLRGLLLCSIIAFGWAGRVAAQTGNVDGDKITFRDRDGEKYSLREYVDLRFAYNAEALEIATKEIARRLEILNHAHQQALDVQATYLPRELFEAEMSKMNERILSLEKLVWAFGGIWAFITLIIPIVLRVVGRMNGGTTKGSSP